MASELPHDVLLGGILRSLENLLEASLEALGHAQSILEAAREAECVATQLPHDGNESFGSD